MESGVLDVEVDADLRAYASRLEAGDESLLDEEDDAVGAFAGEALRALLLRAAAEGELDRIMALPWGIGAAFRQGPGVPSRGGAGVFFACRTTGGQRYWRYVEVDDGDVLDAEAEILRRINPGSAPGEDLATSGYDLEAAWVRAVPTIVEEHNRRADPRYAEERIGPVQQFALDLLRDPAVALPVGASEAAEALSVERSECASRAWRSSHARAGGSHISR